MPDEIVIYQTEDGQTKIDVNIDGETVWLTKEQMAELFGRDRSVVSKHIKNLYEEGELEESSTCANFAQVHDEGDRKVSRDVAHYNLDVIISVGYRVKSQRGVQFRQWATERLREYIIKGFTIDDQRLKDTGGGSYWQELLDRIRDIRSSEKMLYRQVLDLYATASDYDPNSDLTQQFFKIVQNKLHYAAHGHTASEVIFERADADKPFMGLTTFAGSEVAKRDIGIAKNYLSGDELKALNNLVSAYFDIAELRARRHISTTMADFIKQLDNVMSAADSPVLEDAGSVSHNQAIGKAEDEYRKYQVKTVSPVEKEYLNSLKAVEQNLSKKNRGKSDE